MLSEAMLPKAGLSVNEPLSTVDDVAGLRVLRSRLAASLAVYGGVVDSVMSLLTGVARFLGGNFGLVLF